MTIDPCENCGKTFQAKMAPCPDGRIGCLVAHYDKSSFLCTFCGHDNGPRVAHVMKNGPWYEETGIAIINVASISKLKLQ